MNVSFFAQLLPGIWRRIAETLAEILVGLMALFMAGYGAKLVDATWDNTIADFPALSVGVTYLPIPIGGAILFVGCAVGKVTIEQVMRRIWPFYGVMFAVLMLVTYLPTISLWLPRLLGL